MIDESKGFLSSPPIEAIKGSAHQHIAKLIRHNCRIKDPENVETERTKHNLYYVYENEKLKQYDNVTVAQKVQAKKLELFSLVEKD